MSTLTPAPSPAHDDAPRLAPAAATPERREARRSALVGNFVDQFDIFLPVIALGGVLSTRSTIPDGLVFAATLLGRPALEQVGVQVVDAVEPYELMKLRLLNASPDASRNAVSTSSGPISPVRARCWTARTTSFTRALPTTATAAGSAHPTTAR